MEIGLNIFTFSLMYVFLIILLLVMCIYSRAPFWIKIIPISCAIFFLVGSYLTINGLLGRPTTKQLPNEFKFIEYVVEAPIKAKNDPGRIFVFLKDGNGYRLHELPYSRPMHKKLKELKKKKKGSRGQPIDIKRKDKQTKKLLPHLFNTDVYEPTKWRIMNDVVNPPAKDG